MDARRRLLTLVGIMVVVSLFVVLFAIFLLYEAAFAEEEARLAEAAKSHARLIEAVARFDSVHSRDAHPDGWQAATLGQVIDAHNHDEGFGETGEFALARREGNRIIFLLKQRLSGSTVPEPVSFTGKLAEPMQLALSDKSGTTVARDYRGEIVLAAHEPVALLNLGIVAKIDLAEIRAPFIRAGLVSGMVAVLVVVLGALLFFKISNPMIRRMEENAARTRTIFESSSDPIMLLDRNGFFDCNGATLKLFGISSKEEFTKLHPSDFSPPQQPNGKPSEEEADLKIATAFREGSLLFEWMYKKANGEDLPSEILLTAFELGDKMVLQATVRDITDRKRAERELKESENNLSIIYDTVAEVLFQLGVEPDEGYRFLSVNRAFSTATGIPEDHIVGKTVQEIIPEPSLSLVLRNYRKAIVEKRTVRWEETSEYPTGEKTGIVSITPAFNSEGKCTHLVGSVYDTSDRKAAEKEIHDQNVFLQLHNMVAVAANEASDFDSIIRCVLKEVCKHTGWPVGHAYILSDESSNLLEPTKLWYLESPEKFDAFRRVTERTPFESGIGLPGRVLSSGKPAWITDVYEDPNFPRAKLATEIGVHGAFAFPVTVESRVVAVLEFYSTKFQEPEPLLLEIMEDVGTQLGRVIARRWAEEALRESEERQRHVFETALDAIITMDHEGKIIEFNPAALETFGYSQDDVMGKPLADTIIPPNLREKHKQALRRFLATGESSILGRRLELSAIRADGAEFPVELSITRLGHGEPPQFTGFLRDITERDEAEREILQQKQFTDTVLNNLPLNIAVFDPDHKFMFVNPSAVRDPEMREWIVGKDNFEYCAHRSLDISIAEERSKHFEEAVKTKNISTWQHDLIGRDGKRQVLLTSYCPYYEERELKYVLGYGLDITELKDAEEELNQHRKHLEELVEERTAELVSANKELEDTNLRIEEANAHKTRFLSSMSHELRTPLNAVLGFADLLGGQHFGELNEKQAQYISHIRESGKHLLALINDLLDMAKVDAGAMEVELQKLSPIEVVDAIVSMMDSQFRKKTLTVKTSIDPSIETFVADSRKLKQILLNLLSNAIKFTPERGRIEVRVTRENSGMARFEVEDTGIGIEADKQEYIFSEFRQAEPARDAHLGGTGIGLALTRRLVELHGGEIGVVSEPGEGSTFWFTLPQPEGVIEPPVTPAPITPTKIFGRRRRRILVAEDNDVNLALILDMLSIHDHDVVVARNGREALDLVQSHKPDLVLMDMRMPVMDGYEATRRIRKLSDCADLPIVALTASVDNDAQVRQITAGCNAHLSKPIQSSELFKILDEFLQ